ncbi:50S ribosomal protein L18e [uncultured archaeon]|nr:50S ribosomal protein L18e [uncultured archaeon]
MTKTKTKIEKQLKRKTNPVLVETIILAKKNKPWYKVAEVLSTPTKKQPSVNVGELTKENSEIVVIPGKVLSQGSLDKKLKVVALSFSEGAREKILNAKGEAVSILEEIKKNPSGKGIKILG